MSVKYISFDVYDTLIKRIVEPKILYQAMELKLINLDKSYGINFAKNRVNAEKILNKERKNYSLRDIYASNVFGQLGEKEREFLIQLESEYEIDNAQANVPGKKLYEKIRENHVLICISDMYLSSETLMKILKDNGYHRISEVIVSCEWGASKRQGMLFQKVVEYYQIAYQELLHVCDALRSDNLNPRRYGIHTIWMKKDRKFALTGNYYYDMGFYVFGPAIYEFCHWIHENSKGGRNLIFIP
ncbi:MAG: HAD family hydrolase [Lachnospiraceae bacterium]|nr:HAD family hydrolase [Lachnospiraceae bacterium]